jgi:Domain of unknown function (DUF4386)
MSQEQRTARITGLWYLALALSGMVGFLLIRPQLYDAADPAATLGSLTGNLSLAYGAVAADLAVVTAQAGAAVWFYKLFRPLNPVAAWGVAAFGVANAVVILMSALFLTTAVAIADDAALAVGDASAATVALLLQLSSAAWSVGGIFFGLWLIPMGYSVVSSRAMPMALGWLLVAGGVGYVLSAFVDNAAPAAPPAVSGVLTLAATVGEFWMIGYLLIKGIRPHRGENAATDSLVESRMSAGVGPAT